MAKLNKKNHYDILLVGSNLTALLLANAFSGQGHKVALIETSCERQGFTPTANTEKHNLFQEEINYLPFSEEIFSITNWMKSLIDSPLEFYKQTNTPVTLDHGTLSPFVGFGKKNNASLQLLTHYNFTDRIASNNETAHWKELLLDNFKGEYFQNSTATFFHLSDHKIDRITLNGKKDLTADQYIFCESPKNLSNLLPEKTLKSKLSSKLSHTKLWATIDLCYTHNEKLTDSNELHFLMGNKPEAEPCLGRFFKNKDGQILSTWWSLLPSQAEESAEETHHHIKYMKKQIKRAYPNFFDTIAKEKISIQLDTHGEFNLDEKELTSLDSIENLTLASPLLLEGDQISRSLKCAFNTFNNFTPAQTLELE